MKFRFGPFTLDRDTRQLKRGARAIHLSPKAFDLLTALVLERPKAVSKAALQQRLWPDTFVVEANLTNLVAEIRAALSDPARKPAFVRTSHGFGYSFCGVVDAPSRSEEALRPSCWIEWGRRRFPLTAGENVVGRDPGAEVRLDAFTVSRRHARLLVAPDGAMLEDCGSKNGTYRGNERITSPVPLVDGDKVRIGSLSVSFHARGPGSTETMASKRREGGRR